MSLPLLLQRWQTGCSPQNLSFDFARSDADFVSRLELQRKLDGHNEIQDSETHFKNYAGCVNTVHFSPCGNTLVSSGDDLQIIFWDWLTTGSKTLNYPSGHHNNVFQARILPESNNSAVTSCAADGQVRLATVPQGTSGASVTSKQLARHDGRAHKLALVPGSPCCFMSCGEDGEVRHYDLREPNTSITHRMLACRAPSGRRPFTRRLELNSVHCSPSEPLSFVLGGGDQFARVYDLRKSNTSSSTAVRLAEPTRKLVPSHLKSSRQMRGNASWFLSDLHITCAVFNQSGEILASYNDENAYLFSRDGVKGTVERDVARGSNKRKKHDVSAAVPATSSQRNDDEQQDDGVGNSSRLRGRRRRTNMRVIRVGRRGITITATTSRDDIDVDDNVQHQLEERQVVDALGANNDDEEDDDVDFVERASSEQPEPQSTDLTSSEHNSESEFESSEEEDDDDSDVELLQEALSTSSEEQEESSSEEEEEEAGTSSGEEEQDSDDDGDSIVWEGVVEEEDDEHQHNSEDGTINNTYNTLAEPPKEISDLNDDVIMVYKGHRNAQTVKGINFLGENDEFVVSGSDCGHIFVWNTRDGKLRTMLKGDNFVANCLEPHPYRFLTLATSGIDDNVKIWAPTAELPRKELSFEARRCLIQNERRRAAVASSGHIMDDTMLQFIMDNMMLRARGVDVDFRTSSSNEEDDDDDENGHVERDCVIS